MTDEPRDSRRAGAIPLTTVDGEQRYRALVESIDEGFCIVEVLFDDDGTAVDYRFLEVNPAFERQTGLRDATGKRMKSLAPDHEPHWFEHYGQVATTGEPVRFVDEARALNGRWFDVNAFRIGDPEDRQVAILFTDITERKRAEATLRASEKRQAFLLALADRLRPIADPVEIIAAASEELGQHLEVGRCGYGEVDATGAYLIVERDWTDGNMTSLRGTLRLDDFGPEFIGTHRTGRTVVLDDTHADTRTRGVEAAFEAIGGMRASLAVPLVKGGRWVAVLYVQQPVPRRWTPDEVSLIEEVAERTWAALERTRAEAALRKSEERYRTLFESIDEGFCIVEVLFDDEGAAVDYRFLEVNPVFEEQTGLHDAIGKTARELVPELEEHWFEHYGRVAISGEPARFIDDAQPMGGRTFDVNAFRVGDPDNRHVAILFTDVTERKRAHDALRESEERLHQAIEIETVGVIFFRPDGSITFANKAFLRMSGYTREDVQGGLVRWDAMTPPEWMPGTLRAIDEYRDYGHISPYEKEYIRKDGSRWWALFAGTRLTDEEGIKFIIDITGRKRAEVERARLAAIVESSHDAVIGIDRDGEITDWNPAATRLFGYPPAEVVGRPFTMLVPPDHAEDGASAMDRIRSGEEVPPFETVHLRKDGAPVQVEVQPSPVRDIAGGIIGVATVIRDVTERKQLEQAQEDFMAMVSHDLRSPITALSGQAQLMKRRQRYDEKAIDVILEQTRRIARLVSDLQVLVSMEAGGVELLRVDCDLVALARQAADRLRASEGTRQVRVEAADDAVRGSWDPDRISQVFDNLLGNAAKYALQESKIVIRIERLGLVARASVIDHGPGIPASRLPHVFDRFYRAGRDRSSPGLGLGLYISRMLVEAHGGRIEAQSTRGKGSVFTITLPLDG